MPLIATQRHADTQTIVPSSVADSYRATKIRAQGVEWPVIRGHRDWRIRNSTQELSALVDNPKGDADDVASMVYDGRNGIVGRWA